MLRVEIEWVDSGETGEPGWQSKDQIVKSLENIPVISLGWLMDVTEDQVILTQTFDSKHKIHLSPIAIWRKNIIRVSVLRVRKDYNAENFFSKGQETSGAAGEDSDTLSASYVVRSDESPLPTPDFHWIEPARSENEAEDQSIGHIQRALQRLGVS